METAKLKKFAQFARRSLIAQVTARIELVLEPNSAARRERTAAVAELEKAINAEGKDQVVERVAYTWFNRFCALRFMDVNRYNRVRIVSPADPSQFQPEILAEAKMGHLDDEMVNERIRAQVNALLAGQTPSRDPQGEAYRLLLVAACNFWNKDMPFLFQRINDYTELLMPDDLLSGNSILTYTREAMTPDACEDVEVIGWLYQFYISEKKEEVFEGLKKNIKITPENIPAATQLFTPHWIVRYLVENSLGRLWLLNRPNSRLIGQMDYYIKPEQAETDFLRINRPEEIKICDPACGSGHMLTYAFDLLYAIYEEEGYEPAEIPEKILTHNLFGIEIDERAGELAAFALTMKARARQRLFFKKNIRPNICVLENIHFDERELQNYIDFIGRDLFILPLQTTLRQFEEAKNFGSLIRPELTDVDSTLKTLESKNVSGQLFLSETHQKVLQVLRQVDYLSPKYHVVIANPPYMNAGGMSANLKHFLASQYSDARVDLMTSFMERAIDLTLQSGYWAMINLPSWMFLSSFDSLRLNLLRNQKLDSLIHLGRGIFGSDFGTVAFAFQNKVPPENARGIYRRLFDKHVEVRSPEHIKELFLDITYGWYCQSQWQLIKVPRAAIAYWIKSIEIFSGNKIGDFFHSGGRNKTHDNNKYLRFIWEVGKKSDRWKLYCNGGEYRKYFGNEFHLVDWSDEARSFYDSQGGLCNEKFWDKEGLTWTLITAAITSFRVKSRRCLYSSGSPTIFNKNYVCDKIVLGLLNSKVTSYFLSAINPTLNTTVNDVFSLPYLQEIVDKKVQINTETCIDLSSKDWNSYETSLDFTVLPLLIPDYRQPTLMTTSLKFRAHWREMTLEMRRLEEENNRIFIDAYGLQDELTRDVPLNEITLTCNPHYRYGNDKSEDELEALLLADTMREFVSYAVGCMFGRYSLDKPGLILANQGETLEDYLSQIPQPSFPADQDNIIPILDGDWFADDITERFKQFLKLTFGSENYQENLRFIEQALNVKGRRDYSIRDYFLNEFYSDHVRRYKKRPIYWLFTSPKGSFNALIYMHRYRPDTVSVVLNKYLREFRSKLTAHKAQLESISASGMAGATEKTKALKEIERVVKMIAEIEEYEREVLYPLATQRVEIDLDDGVKVNYLKFGGALKKIVGLESKEE
jgi:type II restriction/modification system DNA methylase subunit YeeA